jgi:diguanylate cyclase (GGDEF)-like protein
VFTARFSGLTFRKASQARFEVQLEGLDPEPIATKQREVRYAALPAGSYRFVVRCQSAAGVWSAEPAAFSFVVLPPWWELWWVRVGAVVLVALSIVALVQRRVRRIEADRRRLEAAVTERSAQLAEANRELREMSFTDALTRVRNRRYFATTIEGDVAGTLRRFDPRAARDSSTNLDLIFYVVDIDHFKKVNDVHGHRVGDRVLVETARRLQRCVRDSDVVVRWGGEEFLLVCREADRTKADAVAARVLEAIGSEPLVAEPGLSVRRTCSVGWAALPAHRSRPDALSYEVILEIADKAMYLAKAFGRNQAVGAELTEAGLESVARPDWMERPLEELEPAAFRLTRVAGPEARMSDHPPPPVP